MGLGDFIKGAIGGGLGGSAFGPGGTILGGLGGGLAGLFGGGNGMEEEYRRYLDQINQRQAPGMGPAATAGQSDFRENQRNLISNLEAMAAGRGPSLATQQLKAATDRNVAQQQGLAQQAGVNPALLAMTAQGNSAKLGAQAAQDSAGARMQEQLNAINALGLNIHGARGADEDLNRFNASQQNQNSQANLDAQLRAMGLNDQARLAVLSGMGGAKSQPGLGDQLLAGGAGLFSQYATQKGNSGMPRYSNYGTDPLNQQWRRGV